MNFLKIYLIILIVGLSSSYGQNNLFPNGNVENVFVNDIIEDGDHRSHIVAAGGGFPTYWKLSDGAELSNDGFGGSKAIKLLRSENDVTAKVYSNYWQVHDEKMPFGLPLVPNKEITVSFRYKTDFESEKNSFTASIKLGTVKNLDKKELTIELQASKKWNLVTKKISVSEILWGAEIVFLLKADSNNKDIVWIDDAYLSQQFEGINLIKNHSFEDDYSNNLPTHWQIPIEDQWVSWVGASYRKPIVEKGEAISGFNSLRASVNYAEGSGVSQLIRLNQKEIKPVAIDIWSKLDNSIGTNLKAPYHGPDNYSNLTAFIYHTDGTMQEVNPTFSLGVSDHDWDFRRFGFLPQKPIKDVVVQITLLGSDLTTSLFIDNVQVFEIGSTYNDLEERGVLIPRHSISSNWGNFDNLTITSSEIEVANDDQNIYIKVPHVETDKEIFLYLNPQTQSTFINHFRYLFDVIKISSNGQVYKGTTIEKQGYTIDGDFQPASNFGITYSKLENHHQLTIPFKTLKMSGISFEPFGFNILWLKGDEKKYWNGNSSNNKEMGRIIFAKAPTPRIKSIIFGQRYIEEADQSQDFVTHPQIYAGENNAIITLKNDGKDCQIELNCGIKGEKQVQKRIKLNQHEEKEIKVNYHTGLQQTTDFHINLSSNDVEILNRSYPIQIPSPIEIVLNQEFYYPEEDTLIIEIHNRYRPINKAGIVQIEINDLIEKKIVNKFTKNINESVTKIPIEISNLRINELPVQDYSVKVSYLDEAKNIIGEKTNYFGKINHTKRRKLPPIEKLTIDDDGRIIINNNFRFFPIIPSVQNMEWDECINLGANVYRGWYLDGYEPTYPARDSAWSKNVYFLTIGPIDEKIMDRFETEAESLLVHPSFLSIYAKQFYYWNLTDEEIVHRKRVEEIVRNVSSPRLVIWGHHDSSLLYDHDLPEWPIKNPNVGYCSVKIMGRPGPTWRNIPFITKTEQIINPKRFMLAEVNYYLANHVDEVVPMQYPGNMSLHADDWRGVRNESYLSIIYGADGLYHWIFGQNKDLQRLRGFFQEMNYMWPIFVSDDAENSVKVLPYNSGIDVLLKKWEGKYYLLTANRFEKTQKTNIIIEGFENIKVKKLFEIPNELIVKDNEILDVWEKYGTHIYEIEVKE